jgi:hypothetical protein
MFSHKFSLTTCSDIHYLTNDIIIKKTTNGIELFNTNSNACLEILSESSKYNRSDLKSSFRNSNNTIIRLGTFFKEHNHNMFLNELFVFTANDIIYVVKAVTNYNEDQELISIREKYIQVTSYDSTTFSVKKVNYVHIARDENSPASFDILSKYADNLLIMTVGGSDFSNYERELVVFDLATFTYQKYDYDGADGYILVECVSERAKKNSIKLAFFNKKINQLLIINTETPKIEYLADVIDAKIIVKPCQYESDLLIEFKDSIHRINFNKNDSSYFSVNLINDERINITYIIDFKKYCADISMNALSSNSVVKTIKDLHKILKNSLVKGSAFSRITKKITKNSIDVDIECDMNFFKETISFSLTEVETNDISNLVDRISTVEKKLKLGFN